VVSHVELFSGRDDVVGGADHRPGRDGFPGGRAGLFGEHAGGKRALGGGLIPRATVKIYPDSAHGFLFQHHAEFAADVEAFLARPD